MIARSLPLLTVLLCLALSGCNKDKEEAKEVLPKICAYFPDTQIYKVQDRRVLWIQTKVDGISGETAGTMFNQACQQAPFVIGKFIKFNLIDEMNLDGKSVLIVGFRKWVVVWEVRNGLDQRGLPRAVIMTNQQIAPWMQQHLGFTPTPDHTLVVTLQEAESTPDNQPIQAETLAQVHLEHMQKLQEELDEDKRTLQEQQN